MESLSNQLIEAKNNFDEKLKIKDDENNVLKNKIDELTKMLDEQNTLIGNFREKMFNTITSSPDSVITPDQAYLDQCIKEGYRSMFYTMKHNVPKENLQIVSRTT